VNYGSGQMVYSETDLSANAFGIPWGHTRSYANVLVGTGGNGSSLNGNRWYVSQLKALSFQYTAGVTQPTRVIVVEGATSSEYFNLQDGVYQNEFVGWDSLVWDESEQEFVLTQAGDGQQWVFYDQTTEPALRGQLKRIIDPAGRTVTYDYDETGNLESFEQFEDGQTSGFFYTWTEMNSIASVTLKLDDQLVRRVRFDYYEIDETGGSLDDLKSAIIEQYEKGSDVWRIVARKHYRYYLEGDAHGFASGLKLVIGAGAYQLMLDGGLNPETATETELMTYADFYYEYDADKRVTLERLEGGRRQYSFAYTTNPDYHSSSSSSSSDSSSISDSGPNVWMTKTVETLPDGSEHRVYTNDGYNMLVKILQQVVTEDQWVDYWTYTDQYRPMLHANPSAVESVTEPSGGSTTLTVNLRAAAGLIEVTSYYSTDIFPYGEVAGYVSTRGVQQGSGGTLEVTEKLKYATQTVGGQNLHTISERLVYPVAGMADEDAPTTTYERSYYNDGTDATFQVLELITTAPVVSEDENGSGVIGVSKQVYDRFGRVTWEMNERGVITYTSYVQVTGAMLQRIEDVNTTLLPDPPLGWVAYGEHLITDYVSDAQGRAVQERGPWHEVQLSEWDTTTTAIRRVTFTTYDDEAHEVRNASGYLTGNNPTPTFTVVGAVSRQLSDSNGRVVDEIQAVRCCPTGPLTPGEALPQEKWSRWTHRIYDPWGRLYAQRVYHRIPAQGDGEEIANYLETIYGYDAMGRQNRVVDPAGTIQRTVYDVRDQAVSQWVGTDDTGATDSDPTGGGATGNNMVAVQVLEYDDDEAGGDGNLTQQILPVDDTSGNDRITLYGYDYRDRRETTTQTDGTTTWIAKATYDNLNRVTASVRYHTAVDDDNRLAQSRTYFDALGRVFKTEADGIDPATGDVTGTLTGQNWYDLVGNVIKQSQPGNTAFTKTVYDELNRPTVAYLCCRPGESGVPSGDDNSVVDDTVIEQSNTVYDRGGNAIMQTQKQRFDDATGTGVLGGPNAIFPVPKSRDTYGMTWPDALGRPRVSADYGTNGGSVPTRPDVAQARSDTILVTTNRYKDSGDANALIDPMGIETRWENDQAGRRIKLIEGIAPGQGVGISSSPSGACSNAPYPPHPTPRVTQFCWHPSGQLSKLILVNAETGDQSTRWLFGTTLADSAIASNSLVRTKIYPESDDRPAPAADGPDGIYSRLEYSYNRQGQQTVFKDADGTTHAYEFDKMGNIIADRVTVLAAGLDAAVLRIGTSYDVRGLTAKVTSYDAASSGTVVNESAFEYDAFRNLVADKQSHAGVVDGSTPKVVYAFTSGAGNQMRKVSTTYPNGRVLSYLYGDTHSMDDHLNRVSAEKVTGESQNLVEYQYVGQNWQVRLAYPEPDIMCDYRKQPGQPDGDAGDPYNGYDRFGRTVDIRWSTPIE
jgi:YD repeat-containing protein